MFFRTKLLLSLGCIAALSGTLCAGAHADTPAQKGARATIAALYNKSSQALRRKDIVPIAAMEAPDYQSFLPNRTLNREEDLAMTSQIFASAVQIAKVDSKILSLTWRGPDAVVNVQNTVVFTMAKGSRKSRVETVSISRDYWSPGPQGWQIRQSVHSSIKSWINGKRVQ
jgi:hypothetical protein